MVRTTTAARLRNDLIPCNRKKAAASSVRPATGWFSRGSLSTSTTFALILIGAQVYHDSHFVFWRSEEIKNVISSLSVNTPFIKYTVISMKKRLHNTTSLIYNLDDKFRVNNSVGFLFFFSFMCLFLEDC